MSCTSGVCTPTAKSAVLNVTDLQDMLASGSVKVTTSALTNDIKVQAALTWASADALTLDARRSIVVDQPVSVVGTGGLTLATNDGSTKGDLTFGPSGNIDFFGTSNRLTINGKIYALENSISALASAIAAHPGGRYALANSYDASKDGTYAKSPIGTVVRGTVEGLGNTISNLTINSRYGVGFIYSIAPSGEVRDIGLLNVSVTGNGKTGQDYIGALVATNNGAIQNAYATGSVNCSNYIEAGGLAGYSPGRILNSHSSVAVNGSGCAFVGGLVGLGGVLTKSYAAGSVTTEAGVAGGLVGVEEFGKIHECYATGSVATGSGKTGLASGAGGLVGSADDNVSIDNSYATGAVSGQTDSDVGGLVGGGGAVITSSYSTGAPTAGTGGLVGGFLGYDGSSAGSLTDTYWDTTTSGITNPSQGAGNISNDPGITGLTTSQLRSALPTGFSSSIWGEKPTINDGLPYLLALPPSH